MLTHFVNGLNNLPNWDFDKAFIWITFSDTLAMQSKDKFTEYFNNNLKNNLLTVEDFKQGKLEKNDILFINWQKLVSQAAENRVLRRPSDPLLSKEQGYYFEDIIENTFKENREIVMIVDESHTHLSDLAQSSVIDVVNPKIIINVSATPKYIPNQEEVEEGIARFVSVKREDVVNAGLIKEKIVTQTEEDLKAMPGQDLDELLLTLAIKKREELAFEYKSLGKSINPLIIIQLPNDDHKLKSTGEKTKEQIVMDFLYKKGIDIDKKVALWFDGKRINMDHIENNESGIDLKCQQKLPTSRTGLRIRISAVSNDSFMEHMKYHFRQLLSKYNIGTILSTVLPDNISFIYGPPGTGKTTEVVNIISSEVNKNEKTNILVLTPTNRAADEVSERLCNNSVTLEYTYRYGITESHYLVSNHFEILRNRQNMYLDNDKNIVVTTINRYPYDTMHIGQSIEEIFNINWDLIIVDEASMIDIIPITLLLLNNKATRFIIAGDPKQIKPVTPMDIDECNIYDIVGLDSFKEARSGFNKYPVILLDVQHRSIPAIGNLVSDFCYNGLLKNDKNRERQKPLTLSNIDVDTINMIGYNVEDFSLLYGWNKVEQSSVHIYSAIFAYEFASYISREVNINNSDHEYTVGIVCPYGKQADAIKQMLEQSIIDTSNCKVKCGTAHKFQGGECDIMIVLLNYPSSSAGWEANVNKEYIMNVCMSRARDYLFFLMPEKKFNNDRSIYLMNQRIGRILPQEVLQMHAFDLEETMFGNKSYIAENTSLRCHMPVNVSSGILKRYEVRLSDSALDIQINKS